MLTFLIAVGTTAGIRAALATRGYAQKEGDYAWSLLKQLAGMSGAQSTPDMDRRVQDAIVELDRWDEPHFEAIEAILTRIDPALTDFVFENLEAKQGPEAVVGVSTLLDRLDALESSEERKETRKTDLAAIKTLSERGYPKEERKRLRELVKTAQSVVQVAPVSDDERLITLTALHRWHKEWAAAAKLVITRRDWLIKLGLVKRRKSAKTKDDAVPVAAPVPHAEAPALPQGAPVKPPEG